VRPLCITLALRKYYAVLFGITLLAVSSLVRAQIPNSDIKAAFLYHFTQFVEWPALDAGGMFTICVAGDQATTIALRAWTRDKFVGSHPIQTLVIDGPSEARGCHILFIAACPNPRLQQYLRSVRDSGILIVGEQPGLLETGGMVELFLQPQRVAFRINTEAMQRAHLRVSSRLLQLARGARESLSVGGAQ